MIRASAKNYIRVASVVDPTDYDGVVKEMERNRGRLSLKMRYTLACKAFEHTAAYDRHIADYLADRAYGDVQTCYDIVEG